MDQLAWRGVYTRTLACGGQTRVRDPENLMALVSSVYKGVPCALETDAVGGWTPAVAPI